MTHIDYEKGFFDTEVEIRKLISVYSKTRPGFLSVAEIAQFFKDLYQNINSERNLTPEELSLLIGMIDTNKDNWIGEEELTKVVVMFSRRRA